MISFLLLCRLKPTNIEKLCDRFRPTNKYIDSVKIK